MARRLIAGSRLVEQQRYMPLENGAELTVDACCTGPLSLAALAPTTLYWPSRQQLGLRWPHLTGAHDAPSVAQLDTPRSAQNEMVGSDVAVGLKRGQCELIAR